ncbi:dTDP-4-dehydrorhamnose reductase [Cupriavidus sp. H19C3]|uniref:dTDP-4-dehydrorhamnose reductase family protein n=1 Tax=Cupriavidus sp. H19C3 TaxID=3241603 RepID=UPI003BF8CC9B
MNIAMNNEPMRILVLGASGMLGNAVLREFSRSTGFESFGTVRSGAAARLLPGELQPRVVAGVDVENFDSLAKAFERVRPDVVINCVGLVKQLAEADDALAAIPINSLLPHRLARLCGVAGARFVQMSTDCVFSGAKGMYLEEDFSDAKDLYGRSKYLGEVDYPNAITLRTSIIGHELDGARSLVCWFLAQPGPVKGFRRAIFSGLPTVEIARLIRDHVIPHPELHGLYHVSAEPINKFDLLALVARTYGKTIEIQPDDQFVIDRSLDSRRFRQATGYQPKPWPELVQSMHAFR